MADKKISQLTGATTPLAGTEVLPIVQGGSTVKVSVDNLTAGKAVSAASLSTTGNIVSNTLLRVTNAGQIEQNDGNGGLYFLNSSPTATTTNMRFLTTNASGVAQTNLQLTGGTTRINLFNGSVRLGIAGTGVDFNANTPAAGMTSQLLNWYEEGDWTPTIAFGGASAAQTYAIQNGYYTRIGNLVTVTGRAAFTAKGSSTGDASITGLPFTVANNAAANSAASLRFSAITFAGQAQASAQLNTTNILFSEVSEAGAVTALTHADFTDSSDVVFTMVYRAA
jgi:hypothetical protein